MNGRLIAMQQAVKSGIAGGITFVTGENPEFTMATRA
jgi:hypothetical protein